MWDEPPQRCSTRECREASWVRTKCPHPNFAGISFERVSRLRQHQRADALQHDHAINREVSIECGLLNINPSLP